ncbi:pilus assembly protein [Georgenia sp. TF02-10]|uniref:TadE/TadG family type IV pilus assembly protein n=1 Tax=Georgenia sp. TF02-10 TaxID=2917725 RepID=UPI001FA74862|nr:TadE/TadG family type IV pilus assembly protein [Georgenia sp. TF02-10]UNX54152.1 pilus assembly protein [Georgenia sp. TF02-10]
MVDFILVAVLVLTLVVAVLQLGLALHVRNTLVDAASEGARRGALLGSSPAEGAARTEELIGLSLSPRYGQDVAASTVERGGSTLVRVAVRAPLPVIGLLGPTGVLEVQGHAVLEPPHPAGAGP